MVEFGIPLAISCSLAQRQAIFFHSHKYGLFLKNQIHSCHCANQNQTTITILELSLSLWELQSSQYLCNNYLTPKLQALLQKHLLNYNQNL